MAGIPIKDYLRESRIFNNRVSVLVVLVGLLTLLLFLRLAWLQVVSHRHYATLSQKNRVNPVPIPPVRGLIVDRNGVVLAQNYPVLTLEVTPDQVTDMKALLAELGGLVTLNERDLKNFRKQLRERPRFEALTLRTHLNDVEAARFAVRRHLLNGADLKARLQRHYPQGGLAVHAVGYVGRINEEEMAVIDKTAYRGTDHIGKLGVEQSYEHLLLGKVGFERNETDAHGRTVRNLDRSAPVAGRNLYLHLDARVQAAAEQALGTRRGAVIALDPRTGGVIAFASTPTYDPNPFVNGIDVQSYAALRDSKDKPLINRALNGRYAPGSTIKAFYGLLTLEAGIDPSRTVFCPGHFSLPESSHRFRCWKAAGHGPMNLRDAVVQSCDVYFYRQAVALGVERMNRFLAEFGYGARTGIDLKGESDGLLPTPEWKKARGQPWYPGETVVLGIGQGPILVTPLQLAVSTAGLANRGVVPQPRLAYAAQDPVSKAVEVYEPRAAHTAQVEHAQHFEQQLRHLMDVVHGPGGTARGIGWNAPYHIAGKTGTAQVKSIAQGERYIEERVAEFHRDHALFIAYAPVEDPRIAVAVIVENSGSGGAIAAPVARKVMDQYLLGEQVRAAPAAAAPNVEGD
jgi:penicillin-binding protein 2